MTFHPEKRHRRSIRLKGYDYTQIGAYFITICTQNRECLFGGVIDGEMQLNNDGKMIQAVWYELPQHYPGVDIDAFMVMPNHVHGIIILTVGAGPCACPYGPCACPENGQPQGGGNGQARGPAPTMSLPDVVHRLKSLTTACYRHSVTQNGWRSFPSRLWQRNYYEHIIRSEEELFRIQEYILDNPLKWETDRENPSAQMIQKNLEPWQI